MFPSKVLIPVDGSPASLRALDFAIEMTSQNPGTSFVLLNVQNISAMELAGAAMGSDWQETASQASAKALKEAVGKSEGAGIFFKTLVRTGQAAEAIAQVAREEDIKNKYSADVPAWIRSGQWQTSGRRSMPPCWRR
jgi:nucleotide-binding universal stress UspA family protein